MYSKELQKLSEIAQIGRVLLYERGEAHLEAFLRNALYCWREMPTMNKYKTVKEVCALTGLTRKHLYYFHHAKVVRAVAYANYSVQGYDGYKLYDDTAIEKLQQISLYYQLGLKRDEIKDIMLTPDYDSNMILQTLLKLEQEKRLHIERRIAALEYLVLAGTKNGVSGSLRGLSLDDLGRTLLTIRESSSENPLWYKVSESHATIFAEEFASLIRTFAGLDKTMLTSPNGSMVIQKIIEASNKHLGSNSLPFILGLLMSVLGEGSVAQDVIDCLTPDHGRVIIQYLIDHPEIYRHTYHSSISGDIDNI